MPDVPVAHSPIQPTPPMEVRDVATDVIRDDVRSLDATERSYLLHCERSSGQYLFDAVLDAGREFGIQVDGFSLDRACTDE